MTRDAYALIPPYAASSLYGSDMSMHLERTVTVKASTMNIISAAEQKISQKLRSCFEADMNSRVGFILYGYCFLIIFFTLWFGNFFKLLECSVCLFEIFC